MESGEGSSWGAVVTAILALLALVVALLLAARLFDAEEKSEELCRASIRSNAFVTRASAMLLDAEIQCEPLISEAEEAAGLVDLLAFCRERWAPAWGERPLYAQEGLYCNPCAFVDLHATADLLPAIEEGEAPDGGPLADYLFPLEGSWPAARERFRSLPPGSYAVLFYYLRAETPAELPEEAPAWLRFGCFASDVVAPGSCSPAAADDFDRAGDWLADRGYLVASFALDGLAASLQAASSGRVDVPDWAGAVLVVPNEEAAFRELGCERVAQRAEEASRIEDL